MSQPTQPDFRATYKLFCLWRGQRREMKLAAHELDRALNALCRTSRANVLAALEDVDAVDTQAWSLLMSVLGYHTPDALRATDPSTSPPWHEPPAAADAHLVELLQARRGIQLPPWPDPTDNFN